MSRSPQQRKTDALAKLTANGENVWVSSASLTGSVHVIPVSHTWNGSQVVLATGPQSRTVTNATVNPRVCLALGETRDVVMIDAGLVETVPKKEVSASLAIRTQPRRAWTHGPKAMTTSTWCLCPSVSRCGGRVKIRRANRHAQWSMGDLTDRDLSRNRHIASIILWREESHADKTDQESSYEGPLHRVGANISLREAASRARRRLLVGRGSRADEWPCGRRS